MLSAGGTLEVFENKILGPDVKLFMLPTSGPNKNNCLVKTDERKKQLCLYRMFLCCFSLKKSGNVSLFRIPAVVGNQGETIRQLSQERRRLWLNAIRRTDDSWRKTEHCNDIGEYAASTLSREVHHRCWNRINQTGFHHCV